MKKFYCRSSKIHKDIAIILSDFSDIIEDRINLGKLYQEGYIIDNKFYKTTKNYIIKKAKTILVEQKIHKIKKKA